MIPTIQTPSKNKKQRLTPSYLDVSTDMATMWASMTYVLLPPAVVLYEMRLLPLLWREI
jgi:hypothetical protein